MQYGHLANPPTPALSIQSHIFLFFSDLDVGQSTEFNCDSDANPPAQFEWLQKISDRNDKSKRGQVYSRGQGKTLILKNVTYENEGKWVCVATNSIRGMYVLYLIQIFIIRIITDNQKISEKIEIMLDTRNLMVFF